MKYRCLMLAKTHRSKSCLLDSITFSDRLNFMHENDPENSKFANFKLLEAMITHIIPKLH